MRIFQQGSKGRVRTFEHNNSCAYLYPGGVVIIWNHLTFCDNIAATCQGITVYYLDTRDGVVAYAVPLTLPS